MLSEVPEGPPILPSNGPPQTVNSPLRNEIGSPRAGQSPVEQTQSAVSAGDLSSGAEPTPSISPTLGADNGVSAPVSPTANEGSIPLMTSAYEIQEKDAMVESTTMSWDLVRYQGQKRPAETQDDIDGCERGRVQRRRLEYGKDRPRLKQGGRVKSGALHRRRSKLGRPPRPNKQQKRSWASFRLLVAEREHMIKQKAREKKTPKEETRGEEKKSPHEDGESESEKETTETESRETEESKTEGSESAEESESAETETEESEITESESEGSQSEESSESEGSSGEEWGGIQGNDRLRHSVRLRPRGRGRAQTGGSNSTAHALEDDIMTANFESDESVSVESMGLY